MLCGRLLGLGAVLQSSAQKASEFRDEVRLTCLNRFFTINLYFSFLKKMVKTSFNIVKPNLINKCK